MNPFSTVTDPAYTRVQAGAAFGGPIKKDKTYYYFVRDTRRHETGFSSIGRKFRLVPFDATTSSVRCAGRHFHACPTTPDQTAFLRAVYASRRYPTVSSSTHGWSEPHRGWLERESSKHLPCCPLSAWIGPQQFATSCTSFPRLFVRGPAIPVLSDAGIAARQLSGL